MKKLKIVDHLLRPDVGPDLARRYRHPLDRRLLQARRHCCKHHHAKDFTLSDNEARDISTCGFFCARTAASSSIGPAQGRRPHVRQVLREEVTSEGSEEDEEATDLA